MAKRRKGKQVSSSDIKAVIYLSPLIAVALLIEKYPWIVTLCIVIGIVIVALGILYIIGRSAEPEKKTARQKRSSAENKRVENIPQETNISIVTPGINELESYIDSLNGAQFEQYCAKLLEDNNFFHVEVTKGSGDRGVDIIARRNGKVYAIQCKHWKSKVGNKAVQEVYSGTGIYEADFSVVMTNSFFTKQAKDDAAKLGVILWNRNNILNEDFGFSESTIAY